MTAYLKKIIFLFILCNAVNANAENMTEQEIITAYTRANDDFRQANLQSQNSDAAEQLYQRAILNYEKIINQGNIANAKIFYNLANAYLLKGDIGKAIVNYRRAEVLEPSNSNIRKNLAFARNRRIDKIKVTPKKKVLERLFFWHYDMSTKARFIITEICFALLCLLLTTKIWYSKIPASTIIIIILSILIFAFSSSIAAELIFQANTQNGVIIAESVTARQGDGQNYPESFTEPLHAGTEFETIEKRPGWIHIRLTDDSDTWIPDSSTMII